mmetsp:Transcript_81804/g.190038  ORF Transcript_81804/g.190038 Transcript_81804/m.190038 type:complete len:252 (+) Transcript_81804:586-1341(+)
MVLTRAATSASARFAASLCLSSCAPTSTCASLCGVISASLESSASRTKSCIRGTLQRAPLPASASFAPTLAHCSVSSMVYSAAFLAMTKALDCSWKRTARCAARRSSTMASTDWESPPPEPSRRVSRCCRAPKRSSVFSATTTFRRKASKRSSAPSAACRNFSKRPSTPSAMTNLSCHASKPCSTPSANFCILASSEPGRAANSSSRSSNCCLNASSCCAMWELTRLSSCWDRRASISALRLCPVAHCSST